MKFKGFLVVLGFGISISTLSAREVHFKSANVSGVMAEIARTKSLSQALLDPSVDRIQINASEFSGKKLMRVDDNNKEWSPKIYYLWGWLEDRLTDAQLESALAGVWNLSRAGYTVVVDARVTWAEATRYFDDDENYAMFWSSHGDSSGRLHVWSQDVGREWERKGLSFEPKDVTVGSRKKIFNYICACYSNKKAQEWANVFGSSMLAGRSKTVTKIGLVTVAQCAHDAANNFITTFNQVKNEYGGP